MFEEFKEVVESLNLNQDEKELLYSAIKIHGHLCGAMPIGFLAGLAALRALGRTHEKNMDLKAIVYAGDNHAGGCFVDGVQFATGATFGKGMMLKEPKGKFQFLLIDKVNKKALKVKINYEVMEKSFESPFIKEFRSKGVKPSDVPQDRAIMMFKNAFNLANNNQLFEIKGPFEYDYKESPATFNYGKCQICGDFVAENYLRIENGQKVCLDCFSYIG